MANQRDKSHTSGQGQHSGGSQGGMGSSYSTGSSSSSGASSSQSMTDQAKSTAAGVMESAKDMASSAARRAGDAASYVSDKAQGATASVGSGMQSFAGTIRESAPREGMLGSASSAVADTLESSGRYLEEYGLSGIGDDLTNMIRRNPVPALLVGIGIGFLLARATRS